MSFWAVARTHPNSEKIAIRNLENQDFKYYQPKLLVRKPVKGVVKAIEQPLFPCYLFIHVQNRWACLNSTHGIASILMTGGRPSIVKDSIVEALQQQEHQGFVQLPKVRFVIGDKVTIQSGPFALQQGIVERMPTKERQKLLLSLLSGKAKLLIDETNVIAC